MAIPECDKGCAAVFHHTGGRHKTNCVLNPYDEAAGWLDLVKQQLWQEGHIEQEYLDFLNKKLAPLVES